MRQPRLKNHFLNTKNIHLFTGNNIVIPTNYCSILRTAIDKYISTTDLTSQRLNVDIAVIEAGSSILFYQNHDFQIYTDNTFLKTESPLFDIKYLTQEFFPRREEDFAFIADLVLSSITVNPFLLSNTERVNVKLNKTISGKTAADISRLLQYGWESNYNLDNSFNNNFRLFTQKLVSSQLNESLNIFTGGQPLTYSLLQTLSCEHRFHFLYLFLYRLYDLVVNKKAKVNLCLVISNVEELLNLDNYTSIYINHDQAIKRRYTILNLLNQLYLVNANSNFSIILTVSNVDKFYEMNSFFEQHSIFNNFAKTSITNEFDEFIINF